MIVGIVTGQVVSTRKDEGLTGSKMLVVQETDLRTMKPENRYLVALDTVGAGQGDVVLTVGGSSARLASNMKDVPVDCSIIAIIDTMRIDGETRYDAAAADRAAGRAADRAGG